MTFSAQCAVLTVSVDAFLMRCWNTALVNCLQTKTLMGPQSVYVHGNNIKVFCSDKVFPVFHIYLHIFHMSLYVYSLFVPFNMVLKSGAAD